jgi:acetyl/propionyl-CoA carboxylase alpha subunit
VSTTLSFGNFVFEHDAFLSGQFDTHFVNKYFSAGKIKDKQNKKAEMAAMIALKYYLDKKNTLAPWKIKQQVGKED